MYVPSITGEKTNVTSESSNGPLHVQDSDINVLKKTAVLTLGYDFVFHQYAILSFYSVLKRDAINLRSVN